MNGYLFAYLIYLAEQCELPEKSINHETIVIELVLKWAARNGYLSRNLLEPIRFEKVKSLKQPCFSIEQVELILSNADAWAVYMFATLAFTGM